MTVEKLGRDVKICVNNSEVQVLLSGKMAADIAAILLEHAGSCQACRAKLIAAGVDEKTIPTKDPRSSDTAVGQDSSPKQGDKATAEFKPGEVHAASEHPASQKYPYLAPPQSPDELGRLGQYRIMRVIGEGGMGTVFDAEDTQLQRRVALKVLRYGLDATTRQRFLQEAQLAASLASERIVTIHHIGEDRGCPFIVMELLKGETLDERLKHLRRLPLGEALRIARQAAQGLCVAHAKGLIHRDIKPANVWLERRSSDDGDFRVKLLDFGIARSLASESHLTEDGVIVGTPSYMCPEQAFGLPLDARSDLFSLGCLLYAMLAGESPFARSNTIQSIRAVAEEEAAPIRHKLPHLPAPVEALIQRLLHKEPKSRPPHAQSVVDEIRVLEMLGQPTTGLPAGLQTTIGREAARSKLKLGWGGWTCIAAFVAAATIGAWFQYRHILESRGSWIVSRTPDDPTHFGSPDAGPPVASALPVDDPPPKPAATPAPIPSLPPIKVGLLHSFSGPMATSERPIADAFLFAIDEINAAGGLLGGRRIEPILRDGRSYPDRFAEQAEDLITKQHVVTLFGGWRSSCRKAVEAVCRQHDHLLVFPKADEGLEQSPYVVYMGGAPNQQTTPAVKWAYAFLGKRRFFLVGTEGLFSRASHEIMKDEIKALGATLVGEALIPIGGASFAPIAAEIKKSGADIVLNTVSGSGNIALFQALYEAGLKPDVMPVVSYDLTEEELRTLTERDDQLAGNYASWSYFQSLPEKANQEFIERFRRRFGPTRIVNDPMAAAYAGMHLWALGVEAAKSDRVADIRQAMVHQTFDAPEGKVAIDPVSQRAIRMARIGQISKDLEFDVVWMSPKPIAPLVFPASRSRQEWETYLLSLRDRWGGRWNPDHEGPAPQTLPDAKAGTP